MPRRVFLGGALAASSGLWVGCSPGSPSPSPTPPPPPAGPRPAIPYGVQSGDVTPQGAVVWSKTDRQARMIVEWSPDPSLRGARTVAGPVATAEADFTARVELPDLPAGERIHYRVRFEDQAPGGLSSEPIAGSLVAAPAGRRDVLFAWSGDTAGQGWGIDAARGGMLIYESMRRLRPDFFIHCGDMIYADSPIVAEVPLADGTLWRNLVTPEKSKVAETLAELRGNYAYNLLDESVRRFNAEVAQIVQWDDHEIHNNWYPGEVLQDDRYTERRADVLAARARQAMREYTPIRPAGERIYRACPYGPSLDVFVLDERSYRGPNTENRQLAPGPETAFLGAEQLAWLKGALAASKATWKVVATDMPLGLIIPGGVRGGPPVEEAFANGAGPPLGREHELADLLASMKRARVRNVVFVTADVHYTAAHHYDPARAEFKDFDPFWEFVSGPLHAGTFGPNPLDPTFGPEVRFQRAPAPGEGNLPPSAGMQFFGTIRIDGATEVMTVRLHDRAGEPLWSVDLQPVR